MPDPAAVPASTTCNVDRLCRSIGMEPAPRFRLAAVAKLLDMKAAAVYRLIKSGKLAAIRSTPRHTVVMAEDLESFIASAREVQP